MTDSRAGGGSPPRTHRVRLLAVTGLVLAAYYLVPVAQPTADGVMLLRAGLTVLLLAPAAWFVGREVMRGVRAGAAGLRGRRLYLALLLGIVVFALADFTVARAAPGQFVGLETRTDALYFALATLATVGFGDVHAAGQLARALVSLQMVFDVAVLASAAQVLWRALVAGEPGGTPGPAPD
ncbi:potassium channel family protein [Blastococcus sp. VKM Ac-2987]|uniref:potassium channel family protein n=1 Tax=Blastococcus sp. VKM Ac-2987 TaxID=3004141 RepID=UPI0022AB657D|nr:potassium channel family protein [Blastococcus sp. VKM Ac-2987]MCZ2860636.1 potassium channel family protein [Blastococcus sp. VKM Ac-2987]